MKALKKNAKGDGYNYTDLTAIHNYLESQGLSYYQYVETDAAGNDYIVTIKINEKGEESKPIRGCRIVQATLSGKSNPVQEQGSALTYARRYSLLLAYGLCTTDDDAESLSRPSAETQKAINELYSCVSIAELQKVWGKYKSLQSVKFFSDAKDQKKKQLSI